MNAIEKLLHLQQLDREIDDIRAQAQVFPDRLTQARQEEEQARKNLESSHAQLETLEKEHKDANQTLELENQRLKKSLVRLKQLKTAYEFQALNREVENTKRSNTDLEELILKKMEEMESLKKTSAEQETTWQGLKEALTLIEQETQTKADEFGKVLSAKMDEQKKARQEVDKPILSRYTFIRQRKYADAVVAIRSGSCGGCFMNIPHQMMNEILKSREIVTCPNCSRLLYYMEPAAPAA